MIEKLKTLEDDEIDMSVGAVNTRFEDTELIRKINELVDVVNELQKKFGEIKIKTEITEECLHPTAKVDPYAEQRQWIGKLCWFWEGDPNDKIVDVLSHIDTARLCPFIQCDHQIGWTNCEPVKPDDDIIYKGGDNE